MLFYIIIHEAKLNWPRSACVRMCHCLTNEPVAAENGTKATLKTFWLIERLFHFFHILHIFVFHLPWHRRVCHPRQSIWVSRSWPRGRCPRPGPSSTCPWWRGKARRRPRPARPRSDLCSSEVMVRMRGQDGKRIRGIMRSELRLFWECYV